MRRKDREVSGINDIVEIIRSCKVCRIGLIDAEGLPYIVPLNFGYELAGGNRLVLYFHSAFEGKKISLLKQSPMACFEMDCRHRLVEADTACGHGFVYSSVIGHGKASIVDDIALKQRALLNIASHQTGRTDFSMDAKSANMVAVFKIDVSQITGKSRQGLKESPQ